MASKREMEALLLLTGKIDPSLQRAMKAAQKSTKSLNMESTLLGKASSKAFDIMKKGVALGAIGIGVGLVAVAKQGLELASSLTEVQNVVDVTFGKNSKQVDSWSKTALNSFGLSELSAKQYSSSLGAMMKSSGISSKYLVSMSENLTGLSGDFASFYNLNPADAFQKIQSGISGETEPLKELGINMSVANLQAYALAHGIKTSYQKMSQADQTILRYNYLLNASKDAQGDFIRTQDSYANQQRLFGESFKQLSGTIMKAALPAFTSLMKKGNQMISAFANDPEKVAKLQKVIGSVVDKVVAAIPVAIDLAGKFASHVAWGFQLTSDVFKYIYNNWSTIAPIILGIVSAMAAWKAITQGMAIYKGVMAAIRGTTVAGAAAQWALNAAVLANPMTWIVIAIAAAIGLLVAGIYLLWKNWSQVSAWIVGLWKNNVLPFFQGIGDWFSGLWSGMVGGFQSAWSGISSWFSSLWDGIIGAFKGYVNLYIYALNFLINALNKIHVDIPDWVPKLGGKSFGINIPLIPTFAQGGFANQPSIFGEAGPEAAIPLKKTPRSLSLLNKTAQMLGVGGGNGGGDIHFNFQPVISGAGGGSLMSDLKMSADEFFRMADKWVEDRKRNSFSGKFEF